MNSNKGLMILGALIVPFGIFMIIRGIMLQDSVELGGACTIGSDECNNGQCLAFDGEGICTQICTGPSSCPSGMACETIEVGGTRGQDYIGNYCVPIGPSGETDPSSG